MRDRRLDFWRGLCLVDMILVHLVWEGLDVGPVLAPIIGEYTRFAAGGFVFVAGMGVGVVFLPRARPAASRWSVYTGLWQRAGYILGVHYTAAASFVALDLLRERRPPFASAWEPLRDLLTFRDAPPYGDILPLYVALLMLSPALLELIRRGYWPLVAVASGVLFAVGQWHPWITSPRAPELFPLILWQAVFVAGLLFGTVLPRLDESPRRVRFAVTLGAASAVAGVSMAGYGERLGLVTQAALTFQKVPLNGSELLRYLTLTLAVILSTGFLWRRLERRAIAQFVETLGRKSLAVYVAHVWVQAVVITIATRLWGSGRAQALLAPVALAALGLVARGIDASRPRSALLIRFRGTLRRGAALPAGAAAAALMVAGTRLVQGPLPIPPEGAVVADVSPVDLEGEERRLVGSDGEAEVAEPEEADLDAPEAEA